ncbi:hypothetical protein IAU60_000342 [Kwoniella sp. DSM 27419]
MSNPTPATDFSEGADFISFGFSPSPPPEAGPSRIAHPSLPDKPDSAVKNDEVDRKGKRKASEAETVEAVNGAEGKDAKTKKQKKGKRDRERDKEEKSREKDKTRSKSNGEEPDTGPKNLKEERRAAERHAPWAELVEWEKCRDPAEMLNEEITAFYKYVSPTKEEFEVRLFMIELITRAILKLWPDAEVTPFGSWQTQLYLPQGDIDLVVSNKHFSEANKARLLAEMARAVRNARITDTVAIISRARVPIIKFITTEGKLNVDISLNQVNGISAGRIINQYLDALPGARQLILVVKSFLSQRSMNEVYTGGLGSYAVICLVISFLQLHPKLRRSELDPEDNLGTLLVEFFELYGRNFNYQDVGLSIRKGGFYYLKSSRGWQRPNQSFLLSIEDPQDRDNDISGGSFGIRQVKNTLAGAYELLLMRLFECADELSGRSSGRNKIDYDPDRMSILTGVMGITKETLKQRQELQRLHADGRLQRQLGIPQGADPKNYVTNYREPPVLTSRRDRRRPKTGDKHDVPHSGRKERNTNNGVAAIIVDDDEVDDEMSVSDYFDSDDMEEGQVLSSDSSSEEAVVNGSRAGQLRYRGEQGSDPSEDDFEVLSSPPEESRYENQEAKSHRVHTSDSSSDGSVQEVDPITFEFKGKKQPRGKGGVKSKDRKAFWASKGGAGVGRGHEDEWDDDAEFVGLD